MSRPPDPPNDLTNDLTNNRASLEKTPNKTPGGLTDDQARAAYAPSSVAVRAGAGTGKTHMLTQRYVHHLKTDGLSPLAVVAVTFTERAAAELRARIRDAVAREPDLGDDALYELEAAPISTIHALAASICRAHPDEAEVPPDFEVLDDLDGGLWLAEHLDDALATLPHTVFNALPYSQLRRCLETMLQQPDVAAQALGVGSEGWAALVARYRAEAVAALTGAAAWGEARATLEQHQGQDGDKRETARQHTLTSVRAFDEGEIATGRAALDLADLRGGRKAAWPHGGLDEVKEAIKAVRELVEAAEKQGLGLDLGAADDTLATILPALRDAFYHAERTLREAKRAARVLDFNDLEQGALRGLEHPHVRTYYQQRWHAILVDEVQDTSPAQARLLAALSHHATLTLVGDEKQSIYGFRGADVATFEQMQQHVDAATGQRVSLATSFRSHRHLSDLLNAAAQPLLGDLHQPLTAWRDAPDDGPYLSVYAVASDAKPSKAERQVSEARHLAELIGNLLERKTLVYDKARRTHRPVERGDIAILTRTWKPLDTYSDVLPALGIDALHTGGGNLLDTREAKDAAAALDVFAHPHDDLALAAVLKSPYFALCDRTLAAIATRTPKDQSWWETLLSEPPSEARVATDILRRLRDAASGRASDLPTRTSTDALPSRLLQRLDAETGYSAVIANLPGAARRQADYRAFVEFVRGLEPGSDTFSVVRRLRRLIRGEVEVPRPALQADNAVTLMSIHRAKGLEWPVVILADLDARIDARLGAVLMDPELGVALKVEDDEGEGLEPALYTLLKARQKQRDEDELRRVLYVGLTRARDRLYLSAADAKGGALDVLGPALDAIDLTPTFVPHSAESAVYPQSQPPRIIPPPDDAALWKASPDALGALAEHVAPKVPRSTPPRSTSASSTSASSTSAPSTSADNVPDLWDDVRRYFEMMEEARWLPLIDALSAADLPPPDLDACLLPLDLATDSQNTDSQNTDSQHIDGQDEVPRGILGILVWDTVALVETDVPRHDTPDDFTLLGVADDDPEGVLEPLHNILHNDAKG